MLLDDSIEHRQLVRTYTRPPRRDIIKQTQAKDILTGIVDGQVAKSNDTKRIGEEKLIMEKQCDKNVKNPIKDGMQN